MLISDLSPLKIDEVSMAQGVDMARSDKSNHIAAECKVQVVMAEKENLCQHQQHSADRASSRDIRSPFAFQER